jgi:hypothetical protein
VAQGIQRSFQGLSDCSVDLGISTFLASVSAMVAKARGVLHGKAQIPSHSLVQLPGGKVDVLDEVRLPSVTHKKNGSGLLDAYESNRLSAVGLPP